MEKKATEEQPAEVAAADLGGQVRSAVGRLYRRFRSERPEGGLGDAALAVLTRLHKHGPQTLTELSEHDRVYLLKIEPSVTAPADRTSK